MAGRQLFGTLALVVLAVAGVVHHETRSGRAQDFDINAVFWCDAARGGGQSDADCAATRAAVLQQCTSCHTFVPIVKAQKSADEWAATLVAHRDRMDNLPDGQVKTLGAFLAARFNPQTPPPTLPPELENLGTQQAF